MHPAKLFETDHLQTDVGRRAVRGGMVLVVAQGMQLVLSTASTIILARLLAPEDFGLVAMVVPFVGLLGFLRDSGLHMATIQRPSIDHRQISTLFWFNVGLAFMLMAALAALAPAIAAFFGRPELLWLTLAYAVNMLIGGASIQHAALLKRQMAFTTIAVIGIVSHLAGITVGVVGGLLGWAYWALAAMVACTTVTQTALTWLWCPWIPGLPRRGTGARDMLFYGSGLTISNFIHSVSQNIDGVLIGRLLGATPLGFYNRALQLYRVPLAQLMKPLANVSVPILSRFSDTEDRYCRAYLQSQEMLLIVTAPYAAFLVVYGDMLVRFLLGPEWSLAGQVVQALAIGGLIWPIASTVSWLLVTQGRSYDLACWSPISLLFHTMAILCGLPWGIVGIAVSSALFRYVSLAVFTLWTGRKGPVTATLIWKNALMPFGAAVASMGACLPARIALVEQAPLVSLLAGAALSCTVFLSVLWSLPGGRAALLDMWRLARAALSKATPNTRMAANDANASSPPENEESRSALYEAPGAMPANQSCGP